jgi:hypothetical protein
MSQESPSRKTIYILGVVLLLTFVCCSTLVLTGSFAINRLIADKSTATPAPEQEILSALASLRRRAAPREDGYVPPKTLETIQDLGFGCLGVKFDEESLDITIAIEGAKDATAVMTGEAECYYFGFDGPNIEHISFSKTYTLHKRSATGWVITKSIDND